MRKLSRDHRGTVDFENKERNDNREGPVAKAFDATRFSELSFLTLAGISRRAVIYWQR